MHLLSKKQTTLYGALISLASIFVLYSAIHNIVTRSVFGIIIAVCLTIIYTQMWIQYVKAYKNRLYDRSYAKAKDEFYESLNLILPSAGKIVIEHQLTSIHIYHEPLRFFDDYFSILVVSETDLNYDEEAMVHTAFIPSHFYFVSKRMLFVHKSFDMTVLKITRSAESSEISITPEKRDVVTTRMLRKLVRKTPTDLRHASIEEMDALRTVLLDEENETVF